MTPEKRTPGPWHLGGTANPTTNPRENVWGPIPSGAQSGECVAQNLRPANARLVMFAPQLLDSLRELYAILFNGMQADYDEMTAALGRARWLLERAELPRSADAVDPVATTGH